MWDKRYRPLRFSDVLGQEGAVQVLKSRLSKGTAADTSYVFGGSHGRGKTTIARILGKALLCQNLTSDWEPCNECDNCLDILSDRSSALSELDAASRGTVEHAKAIVDTLAFALPGAKKRVYIFDEVHRMSKEAQDVLLKPLEEKQLVGIFCTTEPEKIRGAIRSRCEEYPIRKVTREDILKRMKWVLDQERVEHEDDAVLTVIDHSGGHVRDILNKLEMISQLGPVRLDVVREYLNLSVVSTYYRILESLGSPAVSIPLAEAACEQVSPEEVSEGLAEAAMNSYRLAHNMFAEFSFVDRDLAQKVYSIYGDSVTKLAEHFLRAPRMSRLGLLSSLLACQSGAPSFSETASAPVVVQVSNVASAPVVAAVPQLAAPEVKPAPVATVAKNESPVSDPAPVTAPKGRRADGVGDLKVSDDPCALTSIDTKAVPLKKAHGWDLPKPGGSVSREPILTPDEWRRKFLSLRAALG